MGGLAFHYLAIGKQRNGLSADMILTNRDFFMGYVPFEIVRDFEVPNIEPPGIATMRRCSLRFRDLTQDQVSQLRFFIEACIDGGTGRTPGLYDVTQETEKDHSNNWNSHRNEEVARER
jgi:hypothetical protein